MFVTNSEVAKKGVLWIFPKPSNRTSFFRSLHIVQQNMYESNTSPKPCMWVLALTQIRLQAGSVWFRNQVAQICLLAGLVWLWNQVVQMSCILVQQTQHHWNQHHHMCALVRVTRCKSLTVLQDWLICLQNIENFSPFGVSELLQSSFVCQLSGTHQAIAKRCLRTLFSHLKTRYR